MLDNEDSIYSAIWEGIKDATKWEATVENLPESDFVSAQALLSDVHEHQAKIADDVFQIMLTEISALPR